MKSPGALRSAAGHSAYEQLPNAAIDPSSSHDEVLDQALELQSQGRFTPAMRTAWDQLRMPDVRLAVDFFLFDLGPALTAERLNDALTALRELPAPKGDVV